MWTRSELKERGKAALHRNYWIVVLATLVVTALTGGTGNAAGNGSLQEGSNIAAGNGDAASNLIQTLFSFFGVAGDMIYKNLIGPMYNGMYVSFILILIITAFSVGLLFNVATIFCRDLYTVLWTLCLIIPGIVKSYEYKMIPYILAENPWISRKRAFEISKNMMDGEKWNAFVLDLSFIGWNLLSTITFGIVGVLYVNPYVNTTWAEFYKVMRENALETGNATREELIGLRKEADI